MELESTVEPTRPASSNGAAREPDGRDGILGSILTLSLGMVESSVRTAAHVGRTLSGEGQRMSDSVITLQEQTAQAVWRTARELNRSAFGLMTDAVNRVESATLNGLAHGQKTSDRVAELAAQASSAAVGSRGQERPIRA